MVLFDLSPKKITSSCRILLKVMGAWLMLPKAVATHGGRGAGRAGWPAGRALAP